jgi:hypothetical protein
LLSYGSTVAIFLIVSFRTNQTAHEHFMKLNIKKTLTGNLRTEGVSYYAARIRNQLFA